MIYKKNKEILFITQLKKKRLLGLLTPKMHRVLSEIAIDYAIIPGLKLNNLNLVKRVYQLFQMTRYQLENKNVQANL